MNDANRRSFLLQSLKLTCALALPSATFPFADSAHGEPSLPPQAPAQALFAKMRWFNDPAATHQSGDQLVVTTRPKTDFWRKTFYGYVTNNGHFFYLPVTGDFIFQAKVAGQYKDLYDQAGLMVRIDDANWLKCGLELVDGIGHASVVVTRDFSDWSTVRGITTKAPVWWRVVRKAASLEVLYSLDGKEFISMRLGYLPLEASADVGIMCCSPEGPGFSATFDALFLTQ